MNDLKLSKIIDKIELINFVNNDEYLKSKYPNDEDSINSTNMKVAYDSISNWKNYEPSKLINLENITKTCGIKKLYYKDESSRFKLGSFKALGGAYAIYNLIKKLKKDGVDTSRIVVTTATDGNHGRSVAWGAKNARCKCKIYIHAHVSKFREEAMKNLGAEVIRVNGNYEDSLEQCKKDAKKNSWYIVSDTSWSGYSEIPIQVMAGYSVIAREIFMQIKNEKPTHIFLPVGVGGLAAAITAFFWQEMNEDLCKIISVESNLSPCLMESIINKKPKTYEIVNETMMAGLSCGEVSEIAWKILKPTLSFCTSISDSAVSPLMKFLSEGSGGNTKIEAGECSTSGLASFLGIWKNSNFKKKIGLNENSIVLLIGTEGATDLNLYNKIISKSY